MGLFDVFLIMFCVGGKVDFVPEEISCVSMEFLDVELLMSFG